MTNYISVMQSTSVNAIKKLILLACLPVLKLASASWSRHEINSGGLVRTYHVYTPQSVPFAGAASGMAVFLHGVGAYRPGLVNGQGAEWQVAQNAEEFGFLGVVPEGSPMRGSPDSLEWNIDIPNGVNEVAFIHAMVDDITARFSLSPQAPRIALGFSNGAGLAALLGCHSSDNLWVAHVGVHIDPRSDYPSTCAVGTSTVPVWSAIGTEDFFITSLTPSPAEGITNQFRALHHASTCPREEPQVEQVGIVSCYSYNQCQSLGELCVYNQVEHTIIPSMTPNAWAFLTGVRGYDLRGESAVPTEGGKPQSTIGQGQPESNGKPSYNYSNYGYKPSDNYSNYGNKPSDNYSNYGNKPSDNYSDNYSNYGNKPSDNYSNYGNKPSDNYSNYGFKPSDNYSDNYSNYGNKPSDNYSENYSNYGNKPSDNYSDNYSNYGNKPSDNYSDNYSNYGNKPSDNYSDNYSNYGNKPSDDYSNYGNNYENQFMGYFYG